MAMRSRVAPVTGTRDLPWALSESGVPARDVGTGVGVVHAQDGRVGSGRAEGPQVAIVGLEGDLVAAAGQRRDLGFCGHQRARAGHAERLYRGAIAAEDGDVVLRVALVRDLPAARAQARD